MGYRSDVYIAVAFANADDLKEVVAVYTIDPRVQKHNLLQEWDVREDNILYYHGDDVKWYDDYEDVQGVEHMLHLADKFHEERDMPVAYRFIRIGEDENDTKTRAEHGGDGGELMEMLWSRMQLGRTVEVTL
jgi:hypothetical protein